MASLITFDLDFSTGNRYQKMAFEPDCLSCPIVVPDRFARLSINLKYLRIGDLLISILLLVSKSTDLPFLTFTSGILISIPFLKLAVVAY